VPPQLVKAESSGSPPPCSLTRLEIEEERERVAVLDLP
jgi:hypothetical protein